MTIQNLDPFPLDDEPLEKTRHLFTENSRVRVIEGPHSGRTGKLLVINTRHEHVVRLDSGHQVAYREREIEPESFSYGRFSAEKVSGGFLGKSFDPIPLDAPEAEPTTSHALLESLRPFLTTSDGLAKALKAGLVSDHDIALIKRCIENVQNCRVLIDPNPLGDYEDENFLTLRIMAEKYAATSVSAVPGDSLNKSRSKSDFFVGQKVRERALGGRTATVTKVREGVIDVDYGDGCTGLAIFDCFESAA